jgi:hypothetical protein
VSPDAGRRLPLALRLNESAPAKEKLVTDSGLTNQWRSLAGVVFVCVGLLSSLPADPQSSGEKAPQYTNHLINEKSPYLLQHAHTPVDWYPWGDEAFAKARKENKPIFLSIGYSTCHW